MVNLLFNFHDSDGDRYASVLVNSTNDGGDIVDLLRFLAGLKCTNDVFDSRTRPTACPRSGLPRWWAHGPGGVAMACVGHLCENGKQAWLGHSDSHKEYCPEFSKVIAVRVDTDTQTIKVRRNGKGDFEDPLDMLEKMGVSPWP